MRLLVEKNISGSITLKNRNIQLVFGQTVHLCHQFPSPSNGILLKEIAKAPVAQHLKHGMVVVVVPNFLQIIVFPAHAQAFLRIDNPFVGCFGITQKVIFELIHPRVGEHEGWIAFDNDG